MVARAVEIGGALVAAGGTLVIVNLNDAVVIAADTCSSMAPDLHAFAITGIRPGLARVRDTSETVVTLDPYGDGRGRRRMSADR